MANSLDPDQARHFVGPDLGPSCLEKFSADDNKNPLAGKWSEKETFRIGRYNLMRMPGGTAVFDLETNFNDFNTRRQFGTL